MLVSDQQIETLQNLRTEAVIHINAAGLHLQKVDELAEQACRLLKIDPENDRYANIAKAVVRFGTDAKTVGERIRLSEVNRRFYEAGYEDSEPCD